MTFSQVKAAWLKRVDAQLLQLLENYENLLSNCQVIQLKKLYLIPVVGPG